MGEMYKVDVSEIKTLFRGQTTEVVVSKEHESIRVCFTFKDHNGDHCSTILQKMKYSKSGRFLHDTKDYVYLKAFLDAYGVTQQFLDTEPLKDEIKTLRKTVQKEVNELNRKLGTTFSTVNIINRVKSKDFALSLIEDLSLRFNLSPEDMEDIMNRVKVRMVHRA